MVAVGHVDRVVLPRSHVEGERLAVIGLLRVVGPAVMSDHVLEERVWADGEIRRIREGEDVLDLAQGESLSPVGSSDQVVAGEDDQGNETDVTLRQGRAAPGTRPDLTRMSVAVPEAKVRALGSSLRPRHGVT